MGRALLAMLLCLSCIDREKELTKFCRYHDDAKGCAVDGGTGGGAAGGSDAGGMGGGGDYDGGQCPGSAAPKLRCTDFGYVGGSGVDSPALASNASGLLAAYTTSLNIHLDQLNFDLDAGSTSMNALFFRPTPPGFNTLVVSGAGTHWVLVWLENGAAWCASSNGDGGEAAFVDAGVRGLRIVSAAVNSTGGVAMIGGRGTDSDSDVVFAESPSGCPTGFTGSRGVPPNVRGMSVVQAPDSPVFTVTSSNGELSIFKPDASTHLSGGILSLDECGSAISQDGTQIQVTYEASGGFAQRPVPYPLAAIPGGSTVVDATPGWWANGRCGADCFGLTWVEKLDAFDGRVRASVTSAGSMPKPGSPYDVVCSVPVAGSAVAVDGYLGKLAVMVKVPQSIDFYICDLP